MTQQDKREMFRHNLHMAVLNAHKHGMSWHHIREALTGETSAIADTDDLALREETTSEHVARDMREGRFPQQSEPRQVTEPSEEQPMIARRTIFPAKDDPALTAEIERLRRSQATLAYALLPLARWHTHPTDKPTERDCERAVEVLRGTR